MTERASPQNLSVTGIIASFYEYKLTETYDAIDLESILHFEKPDRKKELGLPDKLLARLNPDGYLFTFVHKSPRKEKELHNWLKQNTNKAKLIKDGYIDYIYEEKSVGFKSEFQMLC